VHTHKRSSRKKDYLTLESADGLLDLVQHGTIELHAQNVHAGSEDAPDQIVMDFDPGPGVGWKAVVASARDLKKTLDRLGLPSFLKTSGGKGLHVHIPILPKYETAKVKAFAHTLAREMAARHPSLYTATIAKTARHKKIFVDYLRNGEGSTAVAPYSVRARPGAPVAMPITWQELKNIKSGDHFSLGNALAHIQKRKKDPWEGFFKSPPKIPLLEN